MKQNLQMLVISISVILSILCTVSTLSSAPTVNAQPLNASNATEAALNKTMEIIDAATPDPKEVSEEASNATEFAMNEAMNLIDAASNASLAANLAANPLSFDKCEQQTSVTPISNTSSGNNKIYSNNTYKFSIQYPSNWQVQDNKDCLPFLSSVVEFSPVNQFPSGEMSAEKMNDIFDAKTSFRMDIDKLADPYLDTDTMTLKNYTARDYAQSRLDSLSELPLERNFKEIRQNELSVAAHPGWKIEYFVDDFLNKYTYNFEVFTVIDGKLYTLHYSAKPTNVPNTFRLANMMVGSLQFVR